MRLSSNLRRTNIEVMEKMSGQNLDLTRFGAGGLDKLEVKTQAEHLKTSDPVGDQKIREMMR